MTTALPWNVALRALREARGVTQEGWATRLGYGRRTLQRWEQGELVPDADAEQALIAQCESAGLFRRYTQGPLVGVDVGEGWLRDLLAAARTGATGAPAVQAATPRADARLPIGPTRLLGREAEIVALLSLIDSARLVTVTGPGGIGKTRLALEAARSVAERGDAEVLFVDLAPLNDAAQVTSAVAAELGVRELNDEPLLTTLIARLRDRRLLLLLDNFEQVLPAGAALAALLASLPNLRLLVTSRVLLRLRGEHEFALAPLALPESDDPNEVARSPATRLFAERMHELRPEFVLDSDTAAPVAAICRRLDGLPLAIELAAARSKLLPPAALLTRLDRRLPLLVGGARDAPDRQRTLRATIIWSYALLNAEEQRLFRRLSVFPAGCPLDAVEAVCADENAPDAVLETLGTLIDSSLVRLSAGSSGAPRVTMLETLREFAAEQFAEDADREQVRDRLAAWTLRMARHADASQNWVDLDDDLNTVRAVLDRCVAHGEIVFGSRLVGAVSNFWFVRASFVEQVNWSTRLLALPQARERTVGRERLLLARVSARAYLGEMAAAIDDAQEAIAIGRETGDRAGVAVGLRQLAWAMLRAGRDPVRVGETLNEGLALAQSLDDPRILWWYAYYLADNALRLGDAATSARWCEQLEKLAAGAPAGLARQMRYVRAEVFLKRAFLQRRWPEASQRLDELEALGRESSRDRGAALGTRGVLALAEQRYGQAAEMLLASLASYAERSVRLDIVIAVEAVGKLAARVGAAQVAARLFGAVDGYSERFGGARFWLLEADYPSDLAATRSALSPKEFATAWSEGRALTPEQASDAASAFCRAVLAGAIILPPSGERAAGTPRAR